MTTVTFFQRGMDPSSDLIRFREYLNAIDLTVHSVSQKAIQTLNSFKGINIQSLESKAKHAIVEIFSIITKRQNTSYAKYLIDRLEKKLSNCTKPPSLETRIKEIHSLPLTPVLQAHLASLSEVYQKLQINRPYFQVGMIARRLQTASSYREMQKNFNTLKKAIASARRNRVALSPSLQAHFDGQLEEATAIKESLKRRSLPVSSMTGFRAPREKPVPQSSREDFVVVSRAEEQPDTFVNPWKFSCVKGPYTIEMSWNQERSHQSASFFEEHFPDCIHGVKGNLRTALSQLDMLWTLDERAEDPATGILRVLQGGQPIIEKAISFPPQPGS